MARETSVMILTLPSDCTIAKVEAETENIRSQLKSAGRIELNAERVEEIDTSYLQVLLSLKKTAEARGIVFSASGMSDAILRACELYGVTLSNADCRLPIAEKARSEP